MKKLTLLAVVLMVALVAVPASASVQNIKVSGSIDSTYLFRDNFDLGTNIVGDSQQSVFITQTTLRVDADLTDQVSATVALINERPWDSDRDVDTDDSTDIDLNLAYVTMREMLYSPLTVVVGRQVFSYGNSLIVDATGANNVAPVDSGIAAVAADLTKQTALDAVRLVFDYNPLTLEFLYSKVDAGAATTVADTADDDIDLYGVNATYELGDDMNTQVEAYFFARIDKSDEASGAVVGIGHPDSDTVYVPGLRASANILDGLNVQGEVAWQGGNKRLSTTAAVPAGAAVHRNVNRNALAAQFVSNYQVPSNVLPGGLEEYKPVIGYVYTYASGDSNPTDRAASTEASSDEWTAWDPMFEAQGGGTIYNALFSLTNLHIHSVSLTANPMDDVTTKVTWNGLWLDKKFDASAGTSTFTLVQPDGTTPAASISTGETSLGHEIDFEAIYDYTEDVQFGASLGWFLPGDVFAAASDDIASQALIHGIVNF